MARGKGALPSNPSGPIPPYTQLLFCDWTEDGNLLAVAERGLGSSGELVVLGRTGRMLKTIPTDTPPSLDRPGAASWRKYWHR
jgi:hypothetical protein